MRDREQAEEGRTPDLTVLWFLLPTSDAESFGITRAEGRVWFGFGPHVLLLWKCGIQAGSYIGDRNRRDHLFLRFSSAGSLTPVGLGFLLALVSTKRKSAALLTSRKIDGLLDWRLRWKAIWMKGQPGASRLQHLATSRPNLDHGAAGAPGGSRSPTQQGVGHSHVAPKTEGQGPFLLVDRWDPQPHTRLVSPGSSAHLCHLRLEPSLLPTAPQALGSVSSSTHSVGPTCPARVGGPAQTPRAPWKRDQSRRGACTAQWTAPSVVGCSPSAPLGEHSQEALSASL